MLTAIAIRVESPALSFTGSVAWACSGRISPSTNSAPCVPTPRKRCCRAMKSDPRVTKVGKIIRKTRIDELPQLWNVLKGEMSLIGPRPNALNSSRNWRRKSLLQPAPRGQARRHRLGSGVTLYGSSVEDSRRKLEYDLYYAKNMSILLDVRIILQDHRRGALPQGCALTLPLLSSGKRHTGKNGMPFLFSRHILTPQRLQSRIYHRDTAIMRLTDIPEKASV
ncbi:MAG: sugar transferase [Bilophila wadsworthia]